MATKINTDYYGLETDWIHYTPYGDNCYISSYSLRTLATSGNWDIANYDMIDKTAIPWGIPQCSLMSNATTLYYIDSSDVLTAKIHETDVKNNPIIFVRTMSGAYNATYTSGDTETSARTKQTARIIGKTAVSGTNVISTSSADNGSSLSAYNGLTFAPITLLNYQTTKLSINNVMLINRKSNAANMNTGSGNVKVLTMAELKEFEETSSEDWLLVGCRAEILPNNNTSVSGTVSAMKAGFSIAPINQALNYYDDETQQILNVGRITTSIGIGANVVTNVGHGSMLTESEINAGVISSSYPVDSWGSQGMNVSSRRQIFDDVSYHWETHVMQILGSVAFWFGDGDQTANANYRMITHLVIDDSIYDSKFEAYHAAVIHELAFLGLPLILSSADNAKLIGDNDVYLPIFDIEHMITTGTYKTGTASLTEPNALWGDIFDNNIPDWDENYIPPEPVPEDIEEDTGDLYNGYQSGNRFSTYGLNKWCLYVQDVWDIVDGINDLYLSDPSGVEHWQLDFKGANPDDYIVGFYAFPLKIGHSDTTYEFTLGPVAFSGIEVYRYNDSGYFSFGIIDVPQRGNFLDFSPYTTAELYIPLCGSADIDYTFFAGHKMEIIMFYDINTGACTASIYRKSDNGYLLYKSVNGQMGAQIPLSALKMGSYQNVIHSLQAAQKQNEIRLASSAVSVAVAAGALLTAAPTGGTSLIAGAGALGGLATLTSGIEKEKEYSYQLDHTQPSVSQVSAAETQNNYCVGGIYPVLYIKRCRMLQGYDQGTYAHTVGHACCINKTLEDVTGFTVCSALDTSGINKQISDTSYIAPTVEEINMIKQAFGSGVYL